MTQAEAGAIIGVTERSYRDFENGRKDIPAASLFQLAAALGIRVFDPQAGEGRKESSGPADAGGAVAEMVRAHDEAWRAWVERQRRHLVAASGADPGPEPVERERLALANQQAEGEERPSVEALALDVAVRAYQPESGCVLAFMDGVRATIRLVRNQTE